MSVSTSCAVIQELALPETGASGYEGAELRAQPRFWIDKMDFRWIIFLVLWTALAGPVFSSPRFWP